MLGITDSTGMPIIDARDDFRRARRRHRLSRLGRFVGGQGTAELPVLAGAATHGAGAAVRAVIPVERIVGAVEPTPGFDRDFRPTSELMRVRWERVARAVRTGVPLPPVEVVARPDGFYLLDGRHRVSVARAFGQTHIDALVIGTSRRTAVAA